MVKLSQRIIYKLVDWHNFPKAYIDKVIEEKFPSWEEKRGIQGRKIKRKQFYWYGENRPWEKGWELINHRRYKPPVIERIDQWNIFKGDRVQLLVGPDKGKQGVINYIIKERNWVYVEGLNTEYVKIKEPHMATPVCVSREHPLRVLDEVALVDPADNKPTTIQWKFDENGNKVRVSDRSKRIIPIPSIASETRDYKTKASYVEQIKDTKASDLEEITFVPKLKTFEQDIADAHGIIDYNDNKSTPRFYY